MLKSMLFVVLAVVVISGCATSDPKGAPPEAGPQLTETPHQRLGTVAEGTGVAVGANAPDAVVADLAGNPVQLASLFASGPTFVIFYRGGWCPFCNVQLNQLGKLKAEFDARGIQLIAVSVDVPNEGAKTQAKAGVPFAMLSDPTLVAHRAFGVVHETNAIEATAMKGFGIDLAAYSGQDHNDFAIPSLFLVVGGVVRFAHVDNDYQTRPSGKQMLAIADKLFAVTARD
jgi:peroxiredoxin